MQPNIASEYQFGITPSDVKWYALGRGWKSQPSRNPAVAIFVKPESNIQLQVPQQGTNRDMASILCPPLAPATPMLIEELEDETPFERQVTQNLMNGLSVLNESVQFGDPSLILNGIKKGVSADLCDALSSITPPEEDSILQIELSWSPVRPQKSKNISNTLRFAAPDLAYIQNAGRKLREQTVRSDTVEGRIITLKDQPMLVKEMGRTVEIRARIDDKWSTVRFALVEDQYKNACDAYRDKKSVRVRGLLRRGEHSKFYDMNEPESFEVLSR